MTFDIAQLSQAILTFYAVNAVLFFVIFRPGSKSFEKLMSTPAASTRPAAILVLMFHVTLPLLMLAMLSPRFWRGAIRALLNAIRNQTTRVRLEVSMRHLSPQERAAIRAQIAAKVGKNLHLLRITQPTPEQLQKFRSEMKHKQGLKEGKPDDRS